MRAAERDAALKAGSKFYFTGRACKSGHIENRQTSNGACVICRADRLREHRKTELGKQTSKRCAAEFYQRNRSRPEFMAEAVRRASEWHKKNKHLERVKEIKRRSARKFASTAVGRAKKAAYKRQKMKSDPQFKMRNILRVRLYHALNGAHRRGSAIKMLGCEVAAAVKHIESQFLPGMSWRNWGHDADTCWHIDHIKPLSSFDLTSEKQLSEACHFTNLQPLWARDNLIKGATVSSCAP